MVLPGYFGMVSRSSSNRSPPGASTGRSSPPSSREDRVGRRKAPEHWASTPSARLDREVRHPGERRRGGAEKPARSRRRHDDLRLGRRDHGRVPRVHPVARRSEQDEVLGHPPTPRVRARGRLLECPPCTSGTDSRRSPPTSAGPSSPSATSTACTAGIAPCWGRLVEQATSRGATSVAVTFDPIRWPCSSRSAPHPAHLPGPAAEPAGRLRAGRGARHGVHRRLRAAEPGGVRRAGLRRRSARLCRDRRRGRRFGWKNSGNVDTLRDLGARATSMSWSSPISATASGGPRRWPARRLAEGDVEGAAVVLGRPHSVCGTVVHGDHRGLGSASRPRTSDRTSRASSRPTACMPAGWSASRCRTTRSTGCSRAPCRSGRTPPSTAARAGSRATSWTGPTSTSTASGSATSWSEGCGRPVKYEGIEPLVRQMKLDVAQCREILSTIVPS